MDFPTPFAANHDSLGILPCTGFHTFGYAKGTEMTCGTNVKTYVVPEVSKVRAVSWN